MTTIASLCKANDLRMRGVQIVTGAVIEGGKRFARCRMASQ